MAADTAPSSWTEGGSGFLQAPSSRPTGIKQLNDSVWQFYSPKGDPEVEIIFFHGLQMSDSKEAFWKTWLSRDDSVVWPKDWLNQCLPQARILSISYDSFVQKHNGATDPYVITENIIMDMIDGALVGQSCPVVLVGHSLGGIIIKKIILGCYTRKTELKLLRYQSKVARIKNFLRNCKGVFFYATPHGGSQIDYGSSIWSMNQPLVELFKTHSAETARINESFANLRKGQIKTAAIAEGKATRYQWFRPKAKIVEEASARADVDSFYTAEADHFEVCKAKDKEKSAIVQHLVAFVNDMGIAEPEGNIIDLVKYLTEQNDPNLQIAAEWASCEPSDTDQGRNRFSKAEQDGAISRLVECLSEDNSLALRGGAAWALALLTLLDTKHVRLRIAEEAMAIVRLVNCLSGSTNSHLQEGAAWALCRLSAVDGHDSIKLRIANVDGAILWLGKFLSQHDNPDLQEAAAWILCHLTEVEGHDSIRLRIAEIDGAIVWLGKFLSQYDNPDLQEAAAWILCHLTDVEGHDSIRLSIAE